MSLEYSNTRTFPGNARPKYQLCKTKFTCQQHNAGKITELSQMNEEAHGLWIIFTIV